MAAKGQPRDRSTGQYGFQGDWNRLCVCGHELGFHGGEAPHECFNEDRLNIGSGDGLDAKRVPPTTCACRRFRPSRKKVQP